MGLGHKNGRRGRAYQEERHIKVLTQLVFLKDT